jgi:hypothetical protein
MNLYLQQFWSNLGFMTNENHNYFQTLMQGFSFFMLHGKEY